MKRLGLLVFLAAVGCTRQAETKVDVAAPKGTAADPWAVAIAELRRGTEVGVARRVLTQLSADLAANPAAAEPTAPDAGKALAAKLEPDEAQELLAPAYTGLDAAYLADAFYLRDAARSLDVPGLPPEQQAAAAFAWVCRQVYLRPLEKGGPPTLAPTLALRRGYGSGMERAYAFLALAQQLGLDAGFVGPPGRENAPTAPDGKGPFAAVGVRVGSDVLLFDPWTNQPSQALGRAKTTPDALKAWGLPNAAAAVVYVAVPLPAAAPRMKALDAKVGAPLGVRLAQDPAELMARFAPTGPVALWLPSATVDGFAYPRAIAAFLPKDEGGRDLTPRPPRLAERANLEALVRLLPDPSAELRSTKARLQLFSIYEQDLGTLFATTQPREKMQRGQFNEVTKLLVPKDTEYANALERIRTDPTHAATVKAWFAAANEVFDALRVAELPDNASQLDAARAKAENFWRSDARGTRAVLDQTMAAVGRAEVTFLLALCKQEQAERKQARFVREKTDPTKEAAVEAWGAAVEAWSRYLPFAESQSRKNPGRAEHARALADRAARLAKGGSE